MAKGLKTGGRTNGTPNKKKHEFIEAIRKKYPNYNPLIAMIEIATTEDKVDIGIKLQAHKEICKYLLPQLKAMEVKHEVDESIIVSLGGKILKDAKN